MVNAQSIIEAATARAVESLTADISEEDLIEKLAEYIVSGADVSSIFDQILESLIGGINVAAVESTVVANFTD
jgi:predicted Mrr-cat superfamily restriction endonuclease